MSRDLHDDLTAAFGLLSQFLVEVETRALSGEPLTQALVDERSKRVAAFKKARPGLDSRTAAMLDQTVTDMVRSLRIQERRLGQEQRKPRRKPRGK